MKDPMIGQKILLLIEIREITLSIYIIKKNKMGDAQFNGTPEEWDALVKKNKKKQTAVEWLINELQIFATEQEMNIIQQAKEMEKEQIIEAFNQGNIYEGNFFDRVNITAEKYYNETFKSE